jgi:hypothetical protein
MRRIDLQVDGLSVDALVASRYSRCFCLDLVSDLAEVIPSPARNMMELGPLLLSCYTGGSVWDVYLIVARFVTVAWQVDELQN